MRTAVRTLPNPTDPTRARDWTELGSLVLAAAHSAMAAELVDRAEVLGGDVNEANLSIAMVERR